MKLLVGQRFADQRVLTENGKDRIMSSTNSITVLNGTKIQRFDRDQKKKKQVCVQNVKRNILPKCLLKKPPEETILCHIVSVGSEYVNTCRG